MGLGVGWGRRSCETYCTKGILVALFLSRITAPNERKCVFFCLFLFYLLLSILSFSLLSSLSERWF